MRRVRCPWQIALVLVLVALALPSAVRAQAAAAPAARDAARADELFRQGKARLAQQDFAHACPLLEQSYQADAATGTLLALAICHEREGKLGSAYREYSEVAGRSKAEGRNDRQQAAADHAASLENKVSSLTVTQAPARPNNDLPQLVTVTLDGKTLVSTQLGQRLPLDAGEHIVTANADGKREWRASLMLAASADNKALAIPELDRVLSEVAVVPAAVIVPESPQHEAIAASAQAGPTARETHATHAAWSTAQWIGVATAGVGVATLGVGAFFVLRAVHNNNESSKGCTLNLCTADARLDRVNARRDGDIATVAFAAGGALAVTGLVLFAVGAHHAADDSAHAESKKHEQASLGAVPWFGRDALGASLHGSF